MTSDRVGEEEHSIRWFGHVERMNNGEFVKVYMSEVEGPGRRVRPPLGGLR